MSSNSILAIRKFIRGEDDPTIKEIYQLALSSEAQAIASGLNAIPLPQFNNLIEIDVFKARLLLIDTLRFQELNTVKITELAMREAVSGDTPKINLVLESDLNNPSGLKLKSPTENEIVNAVRLQFSANNLILELLNKNVLKILLSVNL